MRRRARVRLRPIEPGPSPPAVAPAQSPASPHAGRRRATARPAPGLRPVSALPRRARAFLVVAMLALVGFAVWVTVRLLAVDALGIAIVLIALSYLGAVVVAIAVVTLTRVAFSLRALPYLLGRAVRRGLVGGLRSLLGRR